MPSLPKTPIDDDFLALMRDLRAEAAAGDVRSRVLLLRTCIDGDGQTERAADGEFQYTHVLGALRMLLSDSEKRQDGKVSVPQ